jgi:uncharacterized protein (TIGR03435 family)
MVRRALIGFAAAVIVPFGIGLTGATTAWGQILHATGPRPAFEVATIKPSKPDETRSGMSLADGGRVFLTTNATLRDLIQEAYNVKSADQIIGPSGWATGWATKDKYDIRATLEEAQVARVTAMPMEQQIDQIRLMLQTLLDERFALKLDASTRQSTIFLLVQSKGGSKVKPSAMAAADPTGVNAPHPVTGPSLTRPSAGKIQAAGVSMKLLADTLSRMPELGAEGGFTMGDLVVDKTNLPGSYDWSMIWTPSDVADAGGLAANDGAPSLFTALQEQLGLKLDKTKGSVEVLVVTHWDRPTAD